MDNTFDLVVVGTGAAASTVANRCRAAGWSVAIVDELPYGGTCQLRGCDPKKVLRRAAEVVDATRLMRRKGERDPGLTIDWPALMAFKRSFTDPVPANRERAFAEAGIDAFKGTARFIDETTLVVGDDRLCTRHVVIASGAKPVPLPMEGAEHVVTCDASARVLDADGTPIDGLYACGNDMESIMAGRFPGPGITLGPAMTFGFIAARHAHRSLRRAMDEVGGS